MRPQVWPWGSGGLSRFGSTPQQLEFRGKAYDGEDERYKGKELERTIVFKERSNHCDDLDAVANGVELGLGACGPIAILHRHVFNSPAVIDSVDGELGLNLEASLKTGKVLTKGLLMAR